MCHRCAVAEGGERRGGGGGFGEGGGCGGGSFAEVGDVNVAVVGEEAEELVE